MWLVVGIAGVGLLDGCLEECGRDWVRSRFVGWLDCGEDDGEVRCEAGCKLDLMKVGSDDCLCAYTADYGAHWIRVWLLGCG